MYKRLSKCTYIQPIRTMQLDTVFDTRQTVGFLYRFLASALNTYDALKSLPVAENFN